MRPTQRVLVALHTDKVEPYAALLEKLSKDKPLALICFGDMKMLEKIPEVVRHASTVILAHSDEKFVQRHVADLFLDNAYADGRLSIPLSGLFKAGDGLTVDPETPRQYSPEDVGMNASILSQIDSIAEEGIRLKAYPGCHVMILREGLPVYNKCFGSYTYEGKEPVKENSLYDLASLTKVTATLLAVMKLYDEGKFGLTDRVADYLPMLKKTDKSRITVQDLLFHESGLPAYWPFYEEAVDMKSCKGGLFRKKPDKNHTLKLAENVYACNDFRYNPEWVSHVPSAEYPLQVADSLFLRSDFSKNIVEQIVKLPLKGKSYRYSCLNFMLLKEMVEKHNIPLYTIKTGDSSLEDTFLCLYPTGASAGTGEENRGSMVLRYSYGDTKVLFTGDITAEEEQQLLEQNISADVLKVAHHGSKYSSDVAFLEKVSSKAAVISCGVSNVYGHPHKEAMERLQKIGCRNFFVRMRMEPSL